MILGMTLSTFTLMHVVISLVGIVSGAIVVYGLLTSNRLDGWTTLFLASTVATSLTGFQVREQFGPFSHWVTIAFPTPYLFREPEPAGPGTTCPR